MKGFVKDLGQLPQDRKKAILEGLQNQIIAQAILVRDDQPEIYLSYLESEIKKASDSMLEMIKASGQDGAILGNISETYIWNKERKRVLMELKSEFMTQQPQSLSPEPQLAIAKNIGVGGVALPDILNTFTTKKVLEEAYNRGWMEVKTDSYNWLGLKGFPRGKIQQCVYMIGQIYGYKKGQSGNDGNNIPFSEFEKIFGISGISARLIKCWATKPQVWRTPIDEMINDIKASTSI